MLKTVVSIGLLRILLGLIGIGSAGMAGRTFSAVRRGTVRPGRHFAWMVRAAVCLAALSFRSALDAVMLGAWTLAGFAFLGGWWLAGHEKPPEDLSQDIVPRDS
jgi:hypothetical protein